MGVPPAWEASRRDLRKAPNTAVPPPCRDRATRKRWNSAILDFRPKMAVPPAPVVLDRRAKMPKT